MEILPWYWSYNAKHKKGTYKALQVITQSPDINISQAARASFNVFFEWAACQDLFNPRVAPDADMLAAKQLINLKEMIEHWPTVARYLKQNRYYDLEGVILEKLTPQSRVIPTNKEREDINCQTASYKLTPQHFFQTQQVSVEGDQEKPKRKP